MTAEEMKVNGERLLKNLFEEYIPNSCKDTQLEREFHVNLDGMPIIGIIDNWSTMAILSVSLTTRQDLLNTV